MLERVAKMVSTHSRPKAAGFEGTFSMLKWDEFQHTAARRRLVVLVVLAKSKSVSTHSRPKAAGKDGLTDLRI